MKFVFVSYLNRSGSSFLLNELSKIQSVCVCPEADILFELFLTYPQKIITKPHIEKWCRLLEKNRKFLNWHIPANEVLNSSVIGITRFEVFKLFLIRFQQTHFAQSRVIVFKQNYLYSLISKLVEQSESQLYFISLLRDPRATWVSQRRTISPDTGKAMCSNQLSFAGNWEQYSNAISKINSENYKHKLIFYEDLISDSSNCLKDIYNFLELDKHQLKVDEDEGSYYSWLSADYKKIHANITKPPLPNKITEWTAELSAVDNAILTKALAKNKFYRFPPQLARNKFLISMNSLVLKTTMIGLQSTRKLKKMVFALRYRV